MRIKEVFGAIGKNPKDSGAHSCVNTLAPLTTITYLGGNDG